MDKVYYYDRNGNLRLTFNEFDDAGNGQYLIDSSDLKNWVWGYDEEFGRISNFRRTKGSYKIAIYVLTRSTADRDALCDIFDEDIQAGQAGWFELRGWKQKCFVTEADHAYMDDEIEWRVTFEIITETSTWTRENTTSYNGVDTAEASDLGRDYSMEEGDTESGRGYAEASGGGSNELMDSFGELLIDSDGQVLIDSSGASGRVGYGYSIVSSYAKRISLPVDGNGYRVTFYGAVTNPVIYLNGNPVRVLTSVSSGERLVVTSNGREKTIYKVSAQGVKTDYFVYRDKEHTPFFSIGKSTELTYGEVKFDFTTIENRSEPSWN